jgi:hypothetical protein
MRTSSAKAKGRRAGQEVKDLIVDIYQLSTQDIIVTPSGVTGPDVLLSEHAASKLPFAIECKNQEKLNIWTALEQAQSHTKCLPGYEPVLFFKRNRSKLYVALDAEYFLKHFKNRNDKP